MRKIGLLGGMSWESSIEYERMINVAVRERLGGVHSADLLIRSYDFAVIEELQRAGDWSGCGQLLAADSARLVACGAEVLALCTNTMHVVASSIETVVGAVDGTQFVHLADATAAEVARRGVDRVALLGTKYTMEHDFYRGRLERHGLDVVVPGEVDRELVHRVIYDELVRGVVSSESKQRYLDVIERLAQPGGHGAPVQGVIAGCTEIELLIGAVDVAPLGLEFFATAAIHAAAIVDAALAP